MSLTPPSRIDDIIRKARYTLADVGTYKRWSDERLISAIDEAQKLIARKFEFIKKVTHVPLVAGQIIYPLPSNLWLIEQVFYGYKQLEQFTYFSLNETNPTWRTDKGEPQAIVADSRNVQQIQIYPIPTEATSTQAVAINSPKGVITSADGYELETPLGVTSDVTGYDNVVMQPLGLVTSIAEYKGLVVHYVSDPEPVVNSTSALGIPPMFDEAMKFYAVSAAFEDDVDVQSQQKSAQALEKFSAIVEDLGARFDTEYGVTTKESGSYGYKAFL